MNDLLERIQFGYDGLIRSVKMTGLQDAEVEVSAMDAHNNREWVNVRFLFKNLIEFKLAQRATYSNVVLSGGIKTMVTENVRYVDFAPYSDEMETVNDFRQSEFYLAAVSVSWELLDYSE